MSNIPKLRFPEFNGEWRNYKLGDLSEIRSASRVHKNQWTESGVPFFRSSDVVADYKGLENKKAFISMDLFEELSKKSGRVKKNDLLVTGGGSIGIPYLLKTNEPLYFKDADLLWFKNADSLNGLYLYMFFLTGIFRKYVSSITHIGTISHYTIEQAKATPIKLPKLEEQEKIASFLSSVDTKIEQLTSKVKLLQAYKKGVMQQIFSQKIRFKADDGSEFPKWEEKKLGDVATFSKGKGISKSDIAENGSFDCIRYGELYTTYSEIIQDVKSKTNLKKEALVFSVSNDVIIPSSGETSLDIATASCIMKEGVALGGDLNIIKTEENGIFLSYYMNNHLKTKIARLSQGSSVIHLYEKHLRVLKLSLPSKPEQQKIADFLTSIDTKIDQNNKHLEQTKLFKKALLQQMFV